MLKTLIKIVALAVTMTAATSARANTNLLTNADFSSHPNYESFSRDVNNNIAPGWAVFGFGNGGIIDIVGSADLNSTPSQGAQEGGFSFWNSTNGGQSTITAPPGGAVYVLGQDSAQENDAYITQMLTGLAVGSTYNVSFDWAGVQLRSADGSNWNGATDERWQVNEGGTYNGFGSQSFTGGTTQVTNVIQVASHGFTGWEHASFSFVAGATSEAFNLQALSTSQGLPPFALLANLDVSSAVPEPATWATMLVGLGVIGAVARRRRQVLATA